MVVDVVDEGIQSPHPLGQPLGDGVPFALADQARHDVERPFPVDATRLTGVVHREGDAHGANRQLGGGGTLRKLGVSQLGEHPQQRPSAGPSPARGRDQFIPQACGVVLLPVDGHGSVQRLDRGYPRSSALPMSGAAWADRADLAMPVCGPLRALTARSLALILLMMAAEARFQLSRLAMT